MLRTRRHLFTIYAEIENLDFEHLEKVCDRIFILTPDAVASVPFPLVRRLQKLGNGVKWVPVGNADAASIRLQMAFLMGRLHQKLPSDIEFAVLSDDPQFDALVQFILDKGRNCLRVRASQTREELPFIPTADAPQIAQTAAPQLRLRPLTATPIVKMPDPEQQPQVRFAAQPTADEATVRHTAAEVVERLVRSGNRPAEVATLKQYIALLNHQLPPTVADKVVTFLALNNDIEIRDKEVVYHF